ncbi:MAG TPA: hypothetical protein PLI09_20395 [Candidatus Hydrogenedentes bacterium]|nr:hypothetical protein [Candidatus Hydrogenedentota bacterium]
MEIALILLLCLISPVVSLWVVSCPPEGLQPSGLHTVDSYAYLSAMAHYRENYFSPYAKCASPMGDHHPSLYVLPHHRLYGMLGKLTAGVSLPPLFVLGLANGISLAVLLFGARGLLRAAVPHQASLAFFIFAAGGGAGGILYMVTSIFGLQQDPSFPQWFSRFFIYELNEGARFQPYLLMDRLYYTLSLGIGFFGLAFLCQALNTRTIWRAVAGWGCVAASAYMNFRVGPMIGCAGLLLAMVKANSIWRWWPGVVFLGVAFVTAYLPFVQTAVNPALSDSVFRSLGGVMWLMPFVSATLLYWFFLPGAVFRGVKELPVLPRMIGGAALGYALVYGLLYGAYQAYYGNWFSGGDTSAALMVSDPALAGAVLGAGAGLWRKKGIHEDGYFPALGWMALWFLLFFCASVSAAGKGWWMQFMPQRGMVMLGLPMAVLAAEGIQRMHVAWPKTADAFVTAIIGCGIASILVTWTVVYGPLGAPTAQRYFPWTNYSFVSKADGVLLARLDQGTALAPSLGDPLFGDIIALRPGMHVVYGNGTMDYSHEVMPDVRRAVAVFFSAGTGESPRRQLIDAWCVDYVYCPDTAPVAPAVIQELRGVPWLECVMEQGRGALFKVRR